MKISARHSRNFPKPFEQPHRTPKNVISYRLPVCRRNGLLVAFGAATNHYAGYLMSSATVEDFKGCDTSMGTIRFPANRFLPAGLVRQLVKARIKENQ